MKRGGTWGPQNDTARGQTMFDAIESQYPEKDEVIAKQLIAYNDKG